MPPDHHLIEAEDLLLHLLSLHLDDEHCARLTWQMRLRRLCRLLKKAPRAGGKRNKPPTK